VLYYPYLIDGKIHIAMKDGECAYADGIKKLTAILTGMARELDDLAESIGTSDDDLAEQVVEPLVNALGSISAILNNATEKVLEMSIEPSNSTEYAE
jgi:hypothetical protein